MIALVAVTIVLPLVDHNPYHLQILITVWLSAMVALSVTLVTGTAGQISLGQAGFLAIGGYTSALLVLRLHWPFELAFITAGLVAAVLGTLLVFPAFRLRAYYLAIATIGIGEIVSNVILNWTSLTRGPMGLVGIPLPSLFGHPAALPPAPDMYWYALAILLLAMLFQWRLVSSGLGRVWRALREDEVAAQAYGINLNRYKALAFAASALIAGLSGAFTAHLYTYLSYDTFPGSLSTLALTMAILGGMGNIAGAVLASLLLTLLPEVFRFSTDLRYLLYGLVLVLFIRFRPQGLLGTD
jgi:branched-chain amino acid transport system permease protein